MLLFKQCCIVYTKITMNIYIFLLHIFVVTSAILISTRYGKEALASCITLFCVLSNLFVLKEITLFGLQATPTDALAIGTVFGLSLMQEYYGKQAARRTIFICFTLGLSYTILTVFQLAYIPCASDVAHAHFAYLLQPMPRIMLASLLSYALSQYVDYSVFGILKKLTSGRYFPLRLYGAAIISQLVDTIAFSFLGLYGIVTNVWSIILISYTIKLFCTLFGGLFIVTSRKLLPAPTETQM